MQDLEYFRNGVEDLLKDFPMKITYKFKDGLYDQAIIRKTKVGSETIFEIYVRDNITDSGQFELSTLLISFTAIKHVLCHYIGDVQVTFKRGNSKYHNFTEFDTKTRNYVYLKYLDYRDAVLEG